MELSVIITIVGVLVALTNIIVEVAKKATWEKLPTNILALIVAVASPWRLVLPTARLKPSPLPGTSLWPSL